MYRLRNALIYDHFIHERITLYWYLCLGLSSSDRGWIGGSMGQGHRIATTVSSMQYSL